MDVLLQRAKRAAYRVALESESVGPPRFLSPSRDSHLKILPPIFRMLYRGLPEAEKNSDIPLVELSAEAK